MIVVRRLNLDTLKAEDYMAFFTRAEAVVEIAKLRARRGPWQEDPVVYGISRYSREEVMS